MGDPTFETGKGLQDVLDLVGKDGCVSRYKGIDEELNGQGWFQVAAFLSNEPMAVQGAFALIKKAKVEGYEIMLVKEDEVTYSVFKTEGGYSVESEKEEVEVIGIREIQTVVDESNPNNVDVSINEEYELNRRGWQYLTAFFGNSRQDGYKRIWKIVRRNKEEGKMMIIRMKRIENGLEKFVIYCKEKG